MPRAGQPESVQWFGRTQVTRGDAQIFFKNAVEELARQGRRGLGRQDDVAENHADAAPVDVDRSARCATTASQPRKRQVNERVQAIQQRSVQVQSRGIEPRPVNEAAPPRVDVVRKAIRGSKASAGSISHRPGGTSLVASTQSRTLAQNCSSVSAPGNIPPIADDCDRALWYPSWTRPASLSSG